jgi:hypothetical protein
VITRTGVSTDKHVGCHALIAEGGALIAVETGTNRWVRGYGPGMWVRFEYEQVGG